jgi:hypothetical protein
MTARDLRDPAWKSERMADDLADALKPLWADDTDD